MSEAREKYYKLKSELEYLGHEGFTDDIENYVNELEQQKAGLLEYLNEIKEKCFEDNYYCGYIGNEIKEFLEKYI